MDSFDPLVCLLIFFLTLILSAYFSVAEMVSLSIRKTRIEIEGLQDVRAIKWVSVLLSQPVSFQNTLVIARYTNVVLYALSAFFLLFVYSRAGQSWWLFPFAILLISFLMFIFSELPGKLVYRKYYKGLNIFWAITLWVIYVLFYLPSLFTISLVNWLGGILSGNENNPSGQTETYTNGNGDKTDEKEVEHEITIFQNALDFSKVKARDCMVPRTEIVAMDINTSIEELRQRFVETHFSKILIYRETTDDIIGYVHSYDLFKKPETIKSILLPVFIVPETINAREVFELFVKQKRSIAVVVDEFGGTAGMLTIEDVIEEIFGEIDDEHDTADLHEEKVSDTEYIFSGRLEIDYLNEKYDLRLPQSEEYDTLAGLILHHLEDIPEPGTVVSIGSYELTATQVAEARIDIIKVKVKDEY